MGICYRCNESGHFARECPNKRFKRRGRDRDRNTRFMNSLVDNFFSKLDVTTSPEVRSSVPCNDKDFYFLLDVSGSMSGYPLETAKETAVELFNTMNESDRISIVTFDSKAFFKLKPRPVGQIRRQREMTPTLDRIFARGSTAIWDAIYMTVSQIRNKDNETIIIVLTDGEDNSSSHTYSEVKELVKGYPKIKLSIVHVGDKECDQYKELVSIVEGKYKVITQDKIKETITLIFNIYYIK